MFSFCAALAALLLGYLLYGRFLARHLGVDAARKTPALVRPDGVDYVPLAPWRVFMIQFLNIAGLGPIFGAIMGAKFGSASFLWIVFGCVFGGAVHDFVAGMASLRRDGVSLPEIHGEALGGVVKNVMRGFTVLVMVLAGVVFVANPAQMLAAKMPVTGTAGDAAGGLLAALPANFWFLFWLVAIFAYYVAATLLPVDKIIGKIYPLFAFALLFMGAALLVVIVATQPPLPELWDGLQNRHPAGAGGEVPPLFPMMFISIACGAVSGFHATQSPMMARCLTSERYARPVFYGAMIAEGVVALVWAAAATVFYHDPALAGGGAGGAGEIMSTAPGVVVDRVTTGWLGVAGSALAFLGVIAAPITSGDTAFRSARLTIADFLKLDQRGVRNRLLITVPLFAGALALLLYMLADKGGFDVIWRYFAWSNQTLATVALWTGAAYLAKHGRNYWLALVPATFMTVVVTSYILCAPKEGFGLPYEVGLTAGVVLAVALFAWFLYAWRSVKTVPDAAG